MSDFNPGAGTEDAIGTTLPSVSPTSTPSGSAGRAEVTNDIETILVQIEAKFVTLYQQIQSLASTFATQENQIAALGASSPAPAPANTALPTISSANPVLGAALTVSTGSWSGSPTGYTYQWYAAGTAISGQTTSGYTPTSGVVGDALTVRVTATNAQGSTTATSPATAAVVSSSSIPANTAVPTISGSPDVGAVLTTSNGTWTGSPTPTFTYQWKSDGANATGAGATTAAYTCAAADVGNLLTCTVTATNSAGSTSATSAATAAVVVSIPQNLTAPTITDMTSAGAYVKGDVLTVSTGTWAASSSSSLPDLVVTSMTLSPSSPTTGQAVTVSCVVQNQGAATPAGDVVGVGFYLGGTVSSSGVTGGTEIGYSDTDTTSLAAGASVTLSMDSGQSWTAVSGSQTITAWVNDIGRFSEASTTNNTLSTTVTVTGTSSAPAVVQAPSAVLPQNSDTNSANSNSLASVTSGNTLLAVVQGALAIGVPTSLTGFGATWTDLGSVIDTGTGAPCGNLSFWKGTGYATSGTSQSVTAAFGTTGYATVGIFEISSFGTVDFVTHAGPTAGATTASISLSPTVGYELIFGLLFSNGESLTSETPTWSNHQVGTNSQVGVAWTSTTGTGTQTFSWPLAASTTYMAIAIGIEHS